MALDTEIKAALLHAQRELARLTADGDGDSDLRDVRAPSRYVGSGASADYVREVAATGVEHRRLVARSSNEPIGADFLRAIKSARRGDPDAFRSLRNLETRGWVEGTDAAGGFLVTPEVLPGYIEMRAATAPLRERVSTFEVRSDEVWVVCEGNSVQVAWTAEAATKLDTTGTLAQKISAVHKLAGTSHISDELLADTNGLAGQIVARQFARAIGIQSDTAIISGTGVGQPLGILNASGVNAIPVDGQSGRELYNSILKALGRLQEKFFVADTITLAPRDLVKFDLSTDLEQRYLFEGGLARQFPAPLAVVPDANVPVDLGIGTDESVIIVGDFKAGGYWFERQPLTVDASQHAAWLSDQTVFRGVERAGFAVALPGAFEILTGITP